MRVAVVTPYYREPLQTLERCHQSVLRQTHPATHFMAADGHAREEIDAWNVRHFRLPLAHDDYGNTPRSLASISAFNQGFDAVAYLDADNWYADDHLESLVALCTEHRLPMAFSMRQIVLSTGEFCPYLEKGEEEGGHADTSCFFITKEAAFLAPIWALMDPQFRAMGDRFMLHVARARVPRLGWTGRKTVFYSSHWPHHFRAMGKEPPPDARSIDLERANAPYDPAINLARIGFDPFA